VRSISGSGNFGFKKVIDSRTSYLKSANPYRSGNRTSTPQKGKSWALKVELLEAWEWHGFCSVEDRGEWPGRSRPGFTNLAGEALALGPLPGGS